LEQDGIEASRVRLSREADIRYVGQSMEVRVAAPSGVIDSAFIAGIIGAFNDAHLKTFGYNYAGKQKVEIVNFCVSGFGVIDRPAIPKLETASGIPPCSYREVYFNGGFSKTPIYDRPTFRAGLHLEGPAVVEEFGSTTVVFPGQTLDVDTYGNLAIRRAR
jgi:N-methylhydantoinase A